MSDVTLTVNVENPNPIPEVPNTGYFELLGQPISQSTLTIIILTLILLCIVVCFIKHRKRTNSGAKNENK